MVRRKPLLICLMLMTLTAIMAQDANISEIRLNARNTDRHPDGDRGYYGLWIKDRMMARFEPQPLFKSPEDSIQKRKEFVRLCGITFEAYEQKDALRTVVYGDSALRTGFDNQQIFFYMADSYEHLGDDERALEFYKQAKSHGMPGGRQALSAFKKRAKFRKKQSKK